MISDKQIADAALEWRKEWLRFVRSRDIRGDHQLAEIKLNQILDQALKEREAKRED